MFHTHISNFNQRFNSGIQIVIVFRCRDNFSSWFLKFHTGSSGCRNHLHVITTSSHEKFRNNQKISVLIVNVRTCNNPPFRHNKLCSGSGGARDVGGNDSVFSIVVRIDVLQYELVVAIANFSFIRHTISINDRRFQSVTSMLRT